MSWRTERIEYLYRTPFAAAAKKYVRDFRGDVHEYFYLDLRDFCNVIPVTPQGEVVMVRQFRVGIERLTLEVPGGVVDAEDESPQHSALRELREESGYGLAAGGRILSLGWAHPNPSMASNRCHYFACGPVEIQGEINNDPNEHTETVLVKIGDIRRKMREGEITHSLILNAFQSLELRQESDEFQPFEKILARFQRSTT